MYRYVHFKLSLDLSQEMISLQLTAQKPAYCLGNVSVIHHANLTHSYLQYFITNL